MGTINYDGRNNVYTYMGWQLITAPDSQQYQLREEAGMNFDSEGFGVINGCYVIACTTHYGKIGDYIDWVLHNGDTLHTIIGDFKSSNDSNWNEYGHVMGNSLNVVEFIVDYDTWYNGHANPGTPSCHPEWSGLISSYENIGDYWNTDPSFTISGNSNLYVITGERYETFKTWKVTYLASYQEDGYFYFNDDKFWRYKIPSIKSQDKNENGLQIYYPSKDVWVNSSAIDNIQLVKMSNGYGSGSIAPNANVEAAVQWAIKKCKEEYITYSNYNRNLKSPNGSSYDCSSFVITAFYVGGYDANANTTHDMKQAFINLGFEWIEMSTIPANSCQRGDILLREYGGPGDGHTQIYIGNNQDANCGGTPASIVSHEEYGYGYGWDGILRYPSIKGFKL